MVSARKRGQLGKTGSSRSVGCRKSGKRGYLGRTDFCRQFVQEVCLWAETETQQGHEIIREDLLVEFERRLASAALFAEEEDAAGLLTPESQKEFSAWNSKFKGLRNCSATRLWQGRYLVTKSGFVDRAKQRTTSMSPLEERSAMEAGWKFWDFVLWLAGCGTAKDLEPWLHQPDRAVTERREAVLSFSDQIPVWLMPTGSKRLMPVSVNRERTRAKRLRVSRAKAAAGEKQSGASEVQPRTLVTCSGTASNSRARFTLIARQLVKNYFDYSQEPQGHTEVR